MAINESQKYVVCLRYIPKLVNGDQKPLFALSLLTIPIGKMLNNKCIALWVKEHSTISIYYEIF